MMHTTSKGGGRNKMLHDDIVVIEDASSNNPTTAGEPISTNSTNKNKQRPRNAFVTTIGSDTEDEDYYEDHNPHLNNNNNNNHTIVQNKISCYSINDSPRIRRSHTSVGFRTPADDDHRHNNSRTSKLLTNGGTTILHQKGGSASKRCNAASTKNFSTPQSPPRSRSTSSLGFRLHRRPKSSFSAHNDEEEEPINFAEVDDEMFFGGRARIMMLQEIKAIDEQLATSSPTSSFSRNTRDAAFSSSPSLLGSPLSLSGGAKGAVSMPDIQSKGWIRRLGPQGAVEILLQKYRDPEQFAVLNQKVEQITRERAAHHHMKRGEYSSLSFDAIDHVTVARQLSLNTSTSTTTTSQMMPPSPAKDIIEENKRLVRLSLPSIRIERQMEKSMEREAKMMRVRQEKQRIDNEYLCKRLESIERYENLEEIRRLKAEMVLRQQWWLNLVVLSKYSIFLQTAHERIINARLSQERKIQAAIVIQRFARKYMPQRRSSKRSRALRVLMRAIGRYARKRRERKRAESINTIMQFLYGLQEALRIPIVMKRFRSSVIKVQRAIRRYLRTNRAQLELLERQWDFLINNRIQYMDKQIKIRASKAAANMSDNSPVVHHVVTASVDAPTPPLSRTRTSDRLISTPLGGARGQQQMIHLSNQELYSVMVEREEIKRIDKDLKMKLLKENLEQRRSKYIRELRQYFIDLKEHKKRMEYEKARRLISQSQNPNGTAPSRSLFDYLLTLPPKPRFKVMLPRAEMEALIDEGWARTKEIMKERANHTLSLQNLEILQQQQQQEQQQQQQEKEEKERTARTKQQEKQQQRQKQQQQQQQEKELQHMQQGQKAAIRQQQQQQPSTSSLKVLSPAPTITTTAKVLPQQQQQQQQTQQQQLQHQPSSSQPPPQQRRVSKLQR